MKDIAIIGAGLAGLTAAELLKDKARITIFEKARGVGGRMSTRRADPYAFDHGAQYFTVRSKEFQHFIDPFIELGIVKYWDARFIEMRGQSITRRENWSQEQAHYIGAPAMNSIGKYLAGDKDIRLETRIGAMRKEGEKWLVLDENGKESGRFDWIICAIPSDQMIEIIPKDFPDYPKLQSIKMKACFALMLGFEKPLPIEFDAARILDGDISWIAANHSKSGRSQNFSLLVHSSHEWAARHIDDDREKVMNKLCHLTTEQLKIDVSDAPHKAIHGWRFASIDKQGGESHFIDIDSQLAVCGDWCIEGRVEAAFTSGFDAAQRIANQFDKNNGAS